MVVLTALMMRRQKSIPRGHTGHTRFHALSGLAQVMRLYTPRAKAQI